MYNFIFTSKLSQYAKDTYLMHILLDGVIVDSSFVEVKSGTSQDDLDALANNKIDLLEGLDG